MLFVDVAFVPVLAPLAELLLLVADGVLVGVVVDFEASVDFWDNFTLIVGLENVKPATESRTNPPDVLTRVVITFAAPSLLITETVALIGASVNP